MLPSDFTVRSVGAVMPKRQRGPSRCWLRGTRTNSRSMPRIFLRCELFARWLPFEGRRGSVPLGEYLDSGKELYYVAEHDAYRQLAGVARSLGIELIDGGSSYDAEMLSLAGRSKVQRSPHSTTASS